MEKSANMKHTLSFILPLAIASTVIAAEVKLPPRPENYNPSGYLSERIEVKPLFDTPLRHTFITRAPDGIYYMTGTVSKDAKGVDFQNNDGVFLWKSSDMKAWEPMGQVWSIERDAAKSPASVWQLEQRLNPDDPDGPLVRGITAPELHFLKGTWWIPYSMNGRGAGLLRSASGKPEGPYEDLGRLVDDAGPASLFEDTDGAVYLVWGMGRIAKLNDNLTALAEAPRQLTLLAADQLGRHKPPHESSPRRMRGASIFRTAKPNGQSRYHLAVDADSSRLGTHTRDTFIFSSDSLFGEYTGHEILLEHGGKSNVFQDAQGRWFGSFYGADGQAVFRDRPGIVTMNYDKAQDRPSRFFYFKDFPTRGPWATNMPLIQDVRLNDQQILNAPDGHYYLTGSVWDNFRHGAATIWKSKTLEPRSDKPDNWEEIRVAPYSEIPAIQRAAERIPGLLDFSGPGKNPNIDGVAWGTEIHYIKGNYYILYQIISSNPIVNEEMKKDGGNYPIFRSATGKAEGPYVYHAMLPASGASLFEDDDGSVYMLYGGAGVAKLKDDLSGIDTEFMKNHKATTGFTGGVLNRERLTLDYDIGFSVVKIGGKYVFFTCNCVGGYDQQYWVSDSIWGPVGRPRVMMPHAGHSFVMKDKEGKWHSLQWSGTSPMRPFLHELHVEDTGDDVIMMPQYEWEHRQSRKAQQSK